MNNKLSRPRFSLIGLALAIFAAGAGAPQASAQPNLPYTQVQFQEMNQNGDFVPYNVPINAGQLNQDFIILANGLVGVNPIARAGLSSSVIASGSAVSLTTATPKTITSVTFGVGTWRIYGYIDYVLASATTTLTQSGFGTTTNSFTNTLQAQDTALTASNPLTTTSATLTAATPWLQFTVATGTQTVYLVAQQTFSAGTVTAYGTLFYSQLK